MADCFTKVKEAFGERLSDEEIQGMIDELQGVQKSRAVNEGLQSVEAAMMDRGKVIAEEAEIAAMIEKRNRYKNILVEQNLLKMIGDADALTDNPALGLEAALVGVNAPFDGALRSVDSLTNGLMNEYAGGMIADLRRAGLLSQFNNMKGDFEREVANVIHALNTPDGQMPNVSKEAVAIGKAMHKYQRASIDRMNQEGGYVRRKSGYVVRQSHKPERMAKAGPDVWKQTIRPLLDFEKMGIPADEIDAFLDSAYLAIESGVRLNREINDIERAFKGPGNIAKKDAASRVLEFKSADAWLEYDKQFGNGSLREGFLQDLTRASRNTALMMNLGTNPRAMVERVAAQAAETFRADKAKRDAFVNVDAQSGRFSNMLDEVTGDINLTSNHTVANVMSGYRALQTVAKLGGAWVSALSDVAFMASNRIYQGRSMADAWADAFRAPFEGLSGGEKRIMADYMGAGLEGQLGDFMSRFNAADNVSGRTSKLMASFFKLNLLGPWTDANKRGVTMVISRDLAMNAGNAFDALPADMQRMLRTYGMDAKQWEIARAAVKDAPDGRQYIMPGDIADVRGAVFTGMNQAQQDALRNKAKSNLFALMASEADFAVPSPGARERAIMRRGYRPGTAAGEAIRFVGQFKSFGVTALTKVMGRHVYGHGAKSISDQLSRGIGANMGIINTLVMGTVMGYFVMQAKEVMKGREPRPADAKAVIAAMLQGGGLGIYGDFLFGEANRFGGGTLETLAGPGIGTASQAIDMLQRARTRATEGEPVDMGGDLVRLAKGNIPFANLFYVKGAMDYLVWYQLQEALNPGYLRRMERRVKRENDQEYWLPPSKVVATGGGFR